MPPIELELPQKKWDEFIEKNPEVAEQLKNAGAELAAKWKAEDDTGNINSSERHRTQTTIYGLPQVYPQRPIDWDPATPYIPIYPTTTPVLPVNSPGIPATGWICPCCGRGVAPWSPTCPMCPPTKEKK
jgi:hypothetical protein